MFGRYVEREFVVRFWFVLVMSIYEDGLSNLLYFCMLFILWIYVNVIDIDIEIEIDVI